LAVGALQRDLLEPADAIDPVGGLLSALLTRPTQQDDAVAANVPDATVSGSGCLV
jgi:hypothetical protein